MADRIWIGTSGWVYNHWRGPVYPQGVTSQEMLPLYMQHFRTVEINNSFYSLPSEATLRRWRETVPPGFVFAVKASRYMTHMKKLKDPEEPIATFFGRIATLGETTGPVLFQLPPRWRVNVERLRDFLAMLPKNYRCTFEFRDHSWYDERVYAALAEYNAAFCIYDLGGHTSPSIVTSDFVYIRLHGPGRAYEGSYDDAALARWRAAIRGWVDDGRTVYCYFDNDQAGYAFYDAQRMERMLVE